MLAGRIAGLAMAAGAAAQTLVHSHVPVVAAGATGQPSALVTVVVVPLTPAAAQVAIHGQVSAALVAGVAVTAHAHNHVPVPAHVNEGAIMLLSVVVTAQVVPPIPTPAAAQVATHGQVLAVTAAGVAVTAAANVAVAAHVAAVKTATTPQ